MEAQSKHFEGGQVVVVAIVGETKVLLIREITKPWPHFYKFISETLEPDETVLNALVGGVREEAGLDLSVRLDRQRRVVDITDTRVSVKELCSPHEIHSGKANRKSGRHTRHFYGLLTSDEIIDSLSGKTLIGDKDETIQTTAFRLDQLEAMVDFLPKHRELIELLKGK